VAQW